MEQEVAALAASEDGVKRVWADVDHAVKEQRLQEVMVDIGELRIGDSSKVMMCLGLGSCVGVVIFDLDKKMAGLAHVMLPEKSMASGNAENASRKFADVAIPGIIESLQKSGCSKSAMRAKIAGGAQMFKSNNDELFDIGKRNVAAVKEQLKNQGIPLLAEDVYGSEGRTMKFIVENSKALVRTKSKYVEL